MAIRLRVGEITEDRLKLAALLGSEAARQVLGEEAPDPETLTWLLRWQSRELLVRGGLAMARAALSMALEKDAPLSQSDRLAPRWRDREELAAACEAVSQWALCPCDTCAEEALNHSGVSTIVNLGPAPQRYAHAYNARLFIRESLVETIRRDPQENGWMACLSVRQGASLSLMEPTPEALASATRLWEETDRQGLSRAGFGEAREIVRASGHARGEARADAVLRAELIPWVLGYGDPVRGRMQARQRG